MKKILTLLKNNFHILLLLVITFLAVEPLTHHGLPPSHDGEYHVVRFYEFDKAIRDGDWYPRWAADFNNGHGIPLFNYVYPFPNYVASLLHAFGMSFIDALKANLLLATFIGVFFFYFWTRLFFDKTAALVAATFFAFAPYRFVDIYVRGSVGEVWALAWFPAFLWTLTLFIQKKRFIHIVLASIFFAFTTFSHNIVGLMFAVFGFTYAIFCFWFYKPTKKIIALSSLTFLLGLCLSAIFWLPALVETKFVKNLQLFNISDHFPEIYQLLIPSWGTGFSGGSVGANQISFQIGIANLIAVCVGFFVLVRSKFVFFLAWFVLVCFLMLRMSESLWQTLPLMNYFQFPWRFLSLIIIICSFIAGAVIHALVGKKRKIIMSFIFISLAVLLSLSYTKPAYYHDRSDAHYLTRPNFIYSTNSQGDMFNTIWIDKKPPLKQNKIEVVDGKAHIVPNKNKTSYLSFTITSDQTVKLLANIAYFPGWKVTVDGKEIEIERTNEGLMTFSVQEGEHRVVLQFNDTMIRRVGLSITLLGVIICVFLLLFRKRFSV